MFVQTFSEKRAGNLPRPQMIWHEDAGRSYQRRLVVVVLIAFLCRLAARLVIGPAHFWDGFTVYFEIANNIASGRGIMFAGEPTAYRVPGYFMFLAAVTRGQQAFFAVAIAQSIIGAATAAMAALIGRELFSSRVGLLAGILTAIYPYYVMHDTGPQETSLQTLLTCAAVFVAIKAVRRPTIGWALATGAALGAVVLTRSTVAPFAMLVPVWLLAFGNASPAARVRTAAVIAMVFLLALAPWLVRANRLVGRPTLSTETGERLWAGNNPYTFTHYPIESIDRSTAVAWDALSPADLAQLGGLKPSDPAFDRFFKDAALNFMTAHPWLTAWRMARKVAIAFSVLPSPRHGFVGNLVYVASFGPIMCLGLMGMIRTRSEWREHGVIYLLFLSFIAVTAIFYAQTSHRSFLDVYWIVFAASVLVAVFPTAAPRER